MDMIAERITTLGGTAMGTVRLACQNSSLAEYPHEITDGADHVEALSSAIADFGKNRVGYRRGANLGDKDTADLLTEISRAIDKHFGLSRPTSRLDVAAGLSP